MGTDAPRVSIGLPVFNGERFLPDAIESYLQQTLPDFELIISDNASTDRTPDICANYAARDDRIRYLRQPRNQGANANYNVVLEAARGPLFKWAACDDVCAPTYLERCVAELDDHPEAVLAHALPVLIDADGDRLERLGEQYVSKDGEVYWPPDAPVGQRGLDSTRADVRYEGVLFGTVWCFEIFGVMRRERVPRQEAFYGTDKVVLSDLALQGTFREVQEPLWFRRCHGATTTKLTRRQRIAWSSGRRGIRRVPEAMLTWNYLTLPLRRSLTPQERAGALRVAVRKVARPQHIRRLFEAEAHDGVLAHRVRTPKGAGIR